MTSGFWNIFSVHSTELTCLLLVLAFSARARRPQWSALWVWVAALAFAGLLQLGFLHAAWRWRALSGWLIAGGLGAAGAAWAAQGRRSPLVRWRPALRIVLAAGLLALANGLHYRFRLTGSFLAWSLLSVGLMALAWRQAVALPSPWREAARFLVLVLALRFALLDNPVAWDGYAARLEAAQAGRRQIRTALEESAHYRWRRRGIQYLAVGSSQTGSIYRNYRDSHEDLEILTLAGMKPLDFVLYREYVASHRPEHVFLYLSEFDVAREPAFDASKMGPRQGLYGLWLWPWLQRLPRCAGSGRYLADALVGEWLPEYKYGFVFRALFPGSRSGAAADSEAGEPASPQDASASARKLRDLMIERLIHNRWSEDGIRYHLPLVEQFCRYCARRGIRVIIVEGHYHPAAYTARNRHWNRRVRAELSALAGRLPGVTYVPRSELPELTEADFVDGYHVSTGAGDRLAAAVVERVQREASTASPVALNRP